MLFCMALLKSLLMEYYEFNTFKFFRRYFNLPKSIAAPVRQGDVVGTVTLTIEGEVIGTTDLIAGSDVARNQVLYTIARVGEFFSSTYFKVVVMLTMIVVAVYAFLFVLAALGVLKPIEKSSKERTNK